ncbi:MAG: lipoprotein ABC transporter ATP-binding protein [Legionella sp. 21-45-4]|nr:MAG: lipoprotein ABC transporter ATP-binding protein [Legionella sp. 21-45-4]
MNKLNPIIECANLSKIFADGESAVSVLQDINCSMMPGERVAIIGPSGSGKSTFLHLLGGLDTPSCGVVRINGHNWAEMSEAARCQLRNKHLGFVYQFHHLLPEFSALENVAMPLLLAGTSVHVAEKAAREVLSQVGLASRLSHKPATLSGGERQRVAIARALVHKPNCVFADEPTGNLDRVSASCVFELMLELSRYYGAALVIVTHDLQLVESMDRVMQLPAGVFI